MFNFSTTCSSNLLFVSKLLDKWQTEGHINVLLHIMEERIIHFYRRIWGWQWQNRLFKTITSVNQLSVDSHAGLFFFPGDKSSNYWCNSFITNIAIQRNQKGNSSINISSALKLCLYYFQIIPSKIQYRFAFSFNLNK